MGFRAKVSVGVSAAVSGTPDVGSARHVIDEVFDLSFGDGTGANQAKNVYSDDFSIVGAGTQTYDLAGALANGLGQTLTFTAIKAIVIKNTGTAPLNYGGGSTPFLGFLGDATDKIVIPAGGLVVLADPTAAGQVVTAGTGDLVTLGGTDAAGTIIIVGEA